MITLRTVKQTNQVWLVWSVGVALTGGGESSEAPAICCTKTLAAVHGRSEGQEPQFLAFYPRSSRFTKSPFQLQDCRAGVFGVEDDPEMQRKRLELALTLLR